jgi:hypothetical protein
MKPTKGRTVLYADGFPAKELSVAVITKVHEDGSVNLVVLPSDGDPFLNAELDTIQHATEGTILGTWQWPPVPPQPAAQLTPDEVRILKGLCTDKLREEREIVERHEQRKLERAAVASVAAGS